MLAESLAVKPLRILQVVSSSATSGAERHCIDLCKLLKKGGHHIEVVIPQCDWMQAELAEAGITAHTFDFKANKGLSALGSMIKLVSRKRYDLVHAHLSRAAYLTLAAGWLKGVPLVCTVHVETAEPAYRLAARKTNRIVAVSNYIRNYLVQSGVKEDFIDVVYNGTDFGDLEYTIPTSVHEEFSVPADRQLVGLIGRVCKEKGHGVAVEALPDVLAIHPDTHLFFVGRKEEGYYETLVERVDQLGLTDRVTFTGNRGDVPRMIDALSFSILPSVMEACPLVALETMARGKPLVASKVGGLSELVLHEKTGLLVDQNAKAFAEGMDYMLRSDVTRMEMGENAKKWIKEKFTVAQMTERLEAVYARAARR